MRLVEVAEFYSPTGGGVRTYIDRKFEAAAEAGHELFVIAPWSEDGFEPRASGGVVQVRAPLLPVDANYRMFWDAAPVHARLDDLKPDVVEASSPWRGAWIVAGWSREAWRADAVRAMFVHAEPVASYPQSWLSGVLSRDAIDRLFSGYWAYMRRLGAQFDVIAAGDWVSARLERQGVGPMTPVDLGVNRDAFSPDLRDEGLRVELLARCGQPPEARLALGVGRFHAQKRWPMVIEAAAAARDSLPLGLVIVGDGMARPAVERAAAGKPFVHLTGRIGERSPLARLMASGDVLLHGCECETFGLVTGEALASGLPVVVPDWGGSSGQADPSVSESYRSGDAASMAEALRRLLSRDPAELRAAGRRSAAGIRSDREHYAALFDAYARALPRGRR